jgi:hypothetical protein
VVRTAQDLRIRLRDADGCRLTVTTPDGPTLLLSPKNVNGAWEFVLPVLHAYAVVEFSRS